MNNPKPSYPGKTVSLLSFHWPLHYPFPCLLSHAFTPQTEHNQGRQPNNQLPKFFGGEGQLFRPKPPKKEGTIGSSRFPHTTNPKTAYINHFDKGFWFFNSLLYTFFFFGLVVSHRKNSTTDKTLGSSKFFSLCFFETFYTFNLTDFYYSSITQSHDPILTLSYLHVPMWLLLYLPNFSYFKCPFQGKFFMNYP